MANKLVWGHDLYKGFKIPKDNLYAGQIDDILPFQMLTLEEKTIDWIKAVADYYETASWSNVERKAARIQKNFWMRHGKLNQSDYIINPTYNEYYAAVGMIVPPESQSPLQQFYPLIPNFVEVLRGEFLKRNNSWTVEAIDPYSVNLAFEDKKSKFNEILMQQAMLEKQAAMAEMGISEESDPQQFYEQMDALKIQMEKVEFESRNFRTTGVQWAEKVLKIHEKRYNLHEVEPDGFECGLITDTEFWHIDLLDDTFKVELINPKWADYHKGPNTKYVSEGDYFSWFDFMSAGDIINRFGRRMKEEDILKLKEIYVKATNLIIPDYRKSHQGAYYDPSKPWLQATDLDPKMNDALLGMELAYNFTRSPNFDHNMEVDILNPIHGRRVTGHPQMFRVMRLYWRSLKRIGWLTKIDRDGTIQQPDWVDENYRVTVEPEYDTSVVKNKTKDNLIYGEHIDWQWVPEWRHIIKISPNQKHTFWMNSMNTYESIYIDGAPVRFQFKGKNNPFDSLPPIEGCEFSYWNTGPHSLVDRLKPLQIVYNICMNKIPHKILKDYGNKIAIDKRSLPTNNTSNKTNGIDPVEEYENTLRESDILAYSLSREAMEGMGQPALPQVLQLSTVQEASFYLQLGQNIKWEAGEIIGITRQRLGGQKASETAYSVQQGIQYSETQTEKYFEQHSNLMQRFRQRMLDAAQYYSITNPASRDAYLTDSEEQLFLDIEGMDNTLPQYNIFLKSRANVRNALSMIADYLKADNTLDIPASAKIGALVEESLPKLMQMIKKAEIERDEREETARTQQLEIQRQEMEVEMEKLRQEQEFEASENQKNRDKDIEVATIRALGGLQSDNDMDSNLDAMENLDSYFRQQEINDARQASKDSINAKRQTDIDKMLVDREKSANDLEKEKIKGQYALKVAKENKNADELKKKSAKKSAKKKK